MAEWLAGDFLVPELDYFHYDHDVVAGYGSVRRQSDLTATTR